MAKIGTLERPAENDSEIRLGEIAATAVWEKGEAVAFQGELWELWSGGWRKVEKEEVEKRVMEWLRTVCVKVGDGVKRGVEADKRKVEGVVWMMMRELAIPFKESGVFLGGEGAEKGWDREWCVAFQDRIVYVGEKGLEEAERGREWFDTGVVPCEWGEGEKGCPVYERCVEQWGGGDGEWVELMERACGMAMTRCRRYHRWVLMEGAVRAGKGTILRLMKRAMGADYAGVGLHGMSGEFGLQGLSHKRVLGCGEAVDLDGPGTQKITAILKGAVGEDEIRVNRKHLAPVEVVMKGMMFVCANGVPRLGNRGGGLSSKMLVLPFKNSFLGREDVELDEKLRGELPGILRRWLGAAQRVRASEPGARWPVPAMARGVMEEFKERSSVMQEFLHDRFVQNEGGFVETGLVWEEWARWRKEGAPGEVVSKKWLVRRMMDESDWRMGTRRSNGLTYVTGVSLKGEQG